MTSDYSTISTFRLSPQQMLFWRQQSAFEPVTLRLRLPAAPDVERLQCALRAVVARHEILRTTLMMVDGAPAQHVGDAPPIDRLWMGAASASHPFVAHLYEERDVAVVAFMAVAGVADMASLCVLASEVSASYMDPNGKGGQPDGMQYADLAEGYHELLLDEAGADYWRERQLIQTSPRSLQAGEASGHRREATLNTPREWDDARIFARWIIFQSRVTRQSRVRSRYMAPGVRQIDGVDLVGPVSRPLDVSFALEWGANVADIEATLMRTITSDLLMADQHDCVGHDDDDIPEFTFEPCVLAPSHFAGMPVLAFEMDGPATPASPFRLRVTRPGELQLVTHGQSAQDFAAALSLLNALVAGDTVPGASPLYACPLSVGALPVAGTTRQPDILAEVAAWVKRAPDTLALSDADGTLTFQALWAEACAASTALVDAGARPGARIALQLQRGRGWLVWWLAAWLADTVVVPFPLDMSASRFREQCRTLGVSLAVAEDDVADAFLQRLSPAARGRATGVRRTQANLARDAYILSTSGSTGLPKATGVGHAALAAYLAWARHRYGIDGGFGALVASDATFDFTQTSLWLPLLAGQAVYFAPEGMRLDALPRLIRTLPSLAFIKLTPTHMQVLAALEMDGEVIPWPDHVVVGGEALSTAMLPPSLRQAGVILHNEYGPTEATVGCCVHTAPVDALAEGPVPIGHAVPGTHLMVWDDGKPAQAGAASGELYIAGAQLAAGYYGDARRTALAFVPHPSPAFPGERCYRTGDVLARAAHDHAGWQFAGRGDTVIKRNGVRIDLQALSNCLLRHPAVSGCHAFFRTPAGNTQPSIVCAVTGDSLSPDAMREWMAGQISALELPNRIVVLEHLPCTPHGKIDQEALERQIDLTPAPRDALTAKEALLASIWSRVLGTDGITATSHFFVEGGDSIRAISVAVEARRAGLDLAADDLFRRPVLRDLAAGLGVSVAPSTDTQVPGERTSGPIEDRFPASQLQMGMIFQNQSNGGDGRYHDIFSYLLQIDALDEGCLREASRRIVQRHPALRSTFDLSGDEPTQVVWATAPDVIDIIDVQTRPADEQTNIVQEWIRAERARGFDIDTLPLLRFAVHRLAPRCIRFTVSFHHAIMDGWSDQQIHTELFDEYRQLQRGVAAPVEVFDSGLRAFVEAERAALNTPAIVDYWRNYLDGAPTPALADVRPLVPGNDSDAAPIEFHRELPVSQAEAIAGGARESGESIPVLLLSAHLRALRVATGETDIVTAYVANCRLDGEGMERSVGLFINTLPLRVNVEHHTWSDLATAVGLAQRDAFVYRRLPYAQIRRMAGDAAMPSALFYFTHFHNGIEQTSALEQFGRDAHEVTSFPLSASFNLCPQTGRLVYTLAFARAHFSPARAAQIFAIYEAALAGMAHGMHRMPLRGSDIPDFALSNLRGAETGTGDTWLHELDVHIRDRPHATAAMAGVQRVTYAQLDERATRIASGLLGAGIGPGDAVGTVMPRGLDFLSALVGVARAGAVLVAVDPNEPLARRNHLLAQTLLQLTDTVVGEAPGGPRAVSLDDLLAGTTAAARPRRMPTEAWPAYRMHTSGSTGLPKCVEISHASYASVLKHFQGILAPCPDDRIMQTTAISFDISMLEYGLALTSGAMLVLLDPEAAVTPAAYAPEPGFTGRSFLQATPSLWSVLRLRGFQGVPRMTALTGGEALPPDLHAWLSQRAEQLWNVYGPTETTIWSTAARIDGMALTIGQPIDGTQVHLLDASMTPLPRGSAGMMHIGGLGVGIGYVGNPRATAAAFLPDPFAEVPGSRMYRSGDLACIDGEGQLVFRGRADAQVKISGHRLELGEIETRLRAHPAIHDALVVPPQDPDDGLAAHLVIAPGLTLPSLQELREWLASHLPPYAIPQRYGTLQDLPRTANGKLDRRGVHAVASIPAAEAIEAPCDELEAIVLKLWGKVLRTDGLGVTTDFLTIGGYSLTAIRIVAQLRDLFGVDVPATMLFTASTVRNLAQHLRQAHPHAQVDQKAAILSAMLQ